jgi:hypothetical protein
LADTRACSVSAGRAAAPISGRKRFSACFGGLCLSGSRRASQGFHRALQGLMAPLWGPRASSSVSRLAGCEPLPPMDSRVDQQLSTTQSKGSCGASRAPFWAPAWPAIHDVYFFRSLRLSCLGAVCRGCCATNLAYPLGCLLANCLGGRPSSAASGSKWYPAIDAGRPNW